MKVVLHKEDISKAHIEFTKEDIEYLNKLKTKIKGKNGKLLIPVLDMERT